MTLPALVVALPLLMSTATPTALVMRGDGVAASTVEQVEQALRVMVSALPDVMLQRPADTLLGIDQVRMAGWNCPDGAPPCMAQLGPALGVQQVLSARLGPADGDIAVHLALIDVASASEVAKERAWLSAADASQWGAALGRLCNAIFGKGVVLTIQAPPDVRLSVDGEALAPGAGPSTLRGLPPGLHSLVAVSSDGARVQRALELVGPTTVRFTPAGFLLAGETAPVETAGGPPVLPIAIAGAGVASGLGGLVLLGAGVVAAGVGGWLLATLARLPDGRVILKEGQTAEQLRMQLNSGLALQVLAVGGGVVGLGLILAGGALAAAGAGWAAVGKGGA